MVEEIRVILEEVGHVGEMGESGLRVGQGMWRSGSRYCDRSRASRPETGHGEC